MVWRRTIVRVHEVRRMNVLLILTTDGCRRRIQDRVTPIGLLKLIKGTLRL